MYTCRCRKVLSTVALCAALSVVLTGPASSTNSIALQKLRVRGATVHLITANLNDPKVKIDIGMAEKGIYHSESFSAMVKRRAPVAAVTGTYFDTRSLLPVGTIIANGKTVCVSDIGTTVCFTGATKVEFVATAKGESCRLSGMDCVLRTGPRLLADGRYVLNPRREGFRHPGLFGKHKRVAMGLTRHNKLLLVVVTTPATFGETASVMKSLGAQEAACLDGGTSSAMSYRGKMVCKPGRALTNIVEVHWSPAYASRALPEPVVTAEAQPESGFGAFISAARLPALPATPARVFPEEVAVFPDLGLSGLSQGWRSLFPVNRTKLSGLKGLENSQNLVHAPANG